MKLVRLLLAIAGVIFISTIAWAEFYKYMGADGTVRYTDDMSLIPEDQRPDVKAYESVYPPVDAMEQETENQSASTENANGRQLTENSDISGSTEKSLKQKKSDELDAMRKELRQTYQEITARRKALGDPPPKGAKSGEKAEYIRKSEKLNKQIKEYNELNNKLDQMVRDYNREISKE